MPNCFQLIRKSEIKEEQVAIPLIQVDEEICKHLKVECDPLNWYNGWFDVIGWDIAFGSTFEECRKKYSEDLKTGLEESQHFWAEMIKILDFLDQNFTTKSWYERR